MVMVEEVLPAMTLSERILQALLRHPDGLNLSDIVLNAYPDTDKEPEYAADTVRITIMKMRDRGFFISTNHLTGKNRSRPGRGTDVFYRLENFI